MFGILARGVWLVGAEELMVCMAGLERGSLVGPCMVKVCDRLGMIDVSGEYISIEDS